MTKFLMTIELDYDAGKIYGTDPKSIAWLFAEILSGKKGPLTLFADDLLIGALGPVRVLSARCAPDKPFDAEFRAGVMPEEEPK